MNPTDSPLLEVPFDFSEGVPILSASVNGRAFHRFLLDSGAVRSCLHRDSAEILDLVADDHRLARVESFRIGAHDFGPGAIRITTFGSNRLDGLLGVEEIGGRCITFDFLCASVRFTAGSFDAGSVPSPFRLFRGRPVIDVPYKGRTLSFILDTGAGSHVLFVLGREKLDGLGEIIEEPVDVKAGFGDLVAPGKFLLPELEVGGRRYDEAVFTLAGPDQYGGRDARVDGILGLGALADSRYAVVDFCKSRFAVGEGA
ncbi:MAG: pepsin/retropepsin-like aspartic protease family protein [Planctomycetota bacterium]|jgi:hypothetical protein